MLESFTIDTFSSLVGDTFAMHVDADHVLQLELIHAASTGQSNPSARRPFSLVFRGPPTPVAVQQIYQLHHPALGRFAPFLVPIGRDERGMLYEAVFT
ncbi:MAG: hypothetical protein JO352_18900 [Chloroflexi bacterium]|nr:hypothetical protein [Chloroflexota bacterium]MBV9602560.1 hypothetical protein [Chloroflexota bacterium]